MNYPHSPRVIGVNGNNNINTNANNTNANANNISNKINNPPKISTSIQSIHMSKQIN